MSRPLLLALPLVLALLAPGCGGGGEAAVGAAADLAPKDALAVVSVDTDLESDQWNRLEELLAKFPDSDRLVAEIRKALADENVNWERDVEPAIGNEVVVVVLGAQRGDEPDLVALTQPDDEAKLDALLEKVDEAGEESVKREVEGWTAVAESDAVLDRYQQALDRGTLAGEDAYERAAEGFPDEALASAYVDGARLMEVLGRLDLEQGGRLLPEGYDLDSIAGAFAAEDDGVRLTAAIRGRAKDDATATKPIDEDLLGDVPSGAVAVLAFGGSSGPLGLREQLRGAGLEEFGSFLGIDVEKLGGLLEEGGVLYVGQGFPIPEVTLFLASSDTDADLEALDDLAGGIATLTGARVQRDQIEGVQVRRLAVFGVFTVYWGAVGDRIIVTTSPRGFRDDGGDSLLDDPDYERSLEAAGVPDDPSFLLYVDFEDLLPMIESLLGAAEEEDVPPEVARNLRPLVSFVAYGSGSVEESEFALFLEIE